MTTNPLLRYVAFDDAGRYRFIVFTLEEALAIAPARNIVVETLTLPGSQINRQPLEP